MKILAVIFICIGIVLASLVAAALGFVAIKSALDEEWWED